MNAKQRLRAFLRERRPADSGIAALRASVDRTAGASPAQPDVEETTGQVGGIALHRFVPAGGSSRTILYLHGGGYVAGSVRSHRNFVSGLAAACAAEIRFPDYRLAPEHPFPAALEDAAGVYRHLLAIGIDAGSIVLAGDSAGGGLALATAMHLRDRKIALPAALWLLSPWADLRPRADASHDRDVDPVLSPGELAAAAPLYAGSAVRADWRLSPMLGAFDGLPPILVHAGGDEMLRTDAEAIVANARRRGIDATLKVAGGMVHVWPLFSDFFPAESATLFSEVERFVARWTS